MKSGSLKRILAIVLSIMMIFGISLSAFAENSGNPPEMPSGGMTPPDFGDGQPPEKPDGDMTPPGSGNGQPPEKPDGEGPGGHGDAPGGKQSQVEGQLGSWSMGGTDPCKICQPLLKFTLLFLRTWEPPLPLIFQSFMEISIQCCSFKNKGIHGIIAPYTLPGRKGVRPCRSSTLPKRKLSTRRTRISWFQRQQVPEKPPSWWRRSKRR